MSEGGDFILPPRSKKRRTGALAGQIGNTFEPLIPTPAAPAVQESPAVAPAPAQEAQAPVAPEAPVEAVAHAAPVADAPPMAPPAPAQEAWRPSPVAAPVPTAQQVQPVPIEKKPRKARPVTTGKLALNLPFTTMQRLDNTFAHLYVTGQMARKSHFVSQAIIELCERIEREQNDGMPFPESQLGPAPTGAPPKLEQS